MGRELKRAEKRLSGERGAALTEFVIVVPLFLAMIVGSLYLTELGVFKLKAMEAARFGAWGFTSKPLSNFEHDPMNPGDHKRSFSEARDIVHGEMGELYGGVTSRWARTVSVRYEPALTDFRNHSPELLPDWAQVEWAGPRSVVGGILSGMGVGTGTESAVSGGFRRVGMNTRGQVQSRVRFILESPTRAREATLSRGLFEAGADPRRFRSEGQVIRGSRGEAIGVTLIADSWRLSQGYSAHPLRSPAGYRDFANGVSTVSARSLNALPGGPVLSYILSAFGWMNSIPGLTTVLGVAVEDPKARLFSRPVINRRQARNPGSSSMIQSGQGDVFTETGGAQQEGGAVRVFDTSPVFVNPNNLSESGYFKSLNQRGDNFMGCPRSELRGCWE